jgi:hypothetical protein
MIRDIERVLGSKIKRERLPGFDYSQHAPEIPSRPKRPVRPQAVFSKPERNRPVFHSRRTAEGNAA